MSKLTKRQLIALAAASAASPAFAGTQSAEPAPAADPATPPAAAPAPTPAKPVENLGKTVKVRIATPAGNVVLALFVERAPITTANFLRYVDSKKFDQASFYRRSIPKGVKGYDFGVVQGGFHESTMERFAAIRHESTAKTGIKHTDGTVSMGRFAPGTATSDFFVCVGDQSFFDASDKDPGFAAFARVIDGMDVIKKVMAMPVSPTAGRGVMKGEILAKPVQFTSVRRVA